MAGFGMLLGDYLQRSGLSMNELARATGIDPSYVSRMIREEREPPRMPVVVRLSEALSLDGSERDRLLVSAGYAPSSVSDLGVWDPTLEGVSSVLADQRLSDYDRDGFRQVVNAVVEHWRFRLNGA